MLLSDMGLEETSEAQSKNAAKKLAAKAEKAAKVTQTALYSEAFHNHFETFPESRA